MSRHERTDWEWEYAVREHDGKVTIHHDRYNDGRLIAEDHAARQRAILKELRLPGEAVVIRRKVTTTVVTTTQRSAWEAGR